MEQIFSKNSKKELLKLTEADRQILFALSLRGYRFLTAQQLALLRRNSLKECQEHLEFLANTGLAKRLFLPDITRPQSGEPIYTLSAKGARVLAKAIGLPQSRLYRPIRKSNFLFLEHSLRVNDLRVALTAAVREKSDIRLVWRDERSLRAEWKKMPRLSVRMNSNGRLAVFPDALFGLKGKSIHQWFALELDRGTMGIAAMKRKMEGYLLLRQSGFHEVYFGVRDFRVVVITSTPNRRERLQKILREIAPGTELFIFVAVPEVMEGARGFIISPEKLLGDLCGEG